MRVHVIAWIAICIGFIALAVLASLVLIMRIIFEIDDWANETWELAKELIECAYKEAQND